jgi:hypothetical protein|uniref:Uncharacterized protein n=1 Tax=viral metagenome TaxID=1070528 RepID=A0A6C0AR40_9ZZZZ
MANVYSYTFDTPSRIGLDQCNLSQTDIQNVASCNYRTQNFFAADCSMKTQIELATTQPGIMYNGGFNSGAGGCNIDTSSRLQIGSIQTNPRCRIDLFHRPFATVPYLGRGSVNPVMEAQIQQGEQIVNKRSINNLGEKSYIKYHQTPLLPAVQDTFNNSATKIENDASDGWIRGGVPSRELTRDTDYFNKHSTYQYA